MVAAPLPAVPAPSEPAAPPASAATEAANTLPPDRSAPAQGVARPIARHASPPPRADGLRADIQRLSRADAQLREGKPADGLRLLAPPVVRELREQAAALRACPEVDSVTPDAKTNTLDVRLKDGYEDGTFIPEKLIKAGYRLKQFKEKEVNIEDVFMTITKGITN